MDEVWLEAAAAVAADAALELRLEAADVYAAEAARTRLLDLSGLLRIRVRCGQMLVGHRVADELIAEHLVLTPVDTGVRDGSTLVVPAHAIITVDGAAGALRDEARDLRMRSIGSWLRERWSEGDMVRILDRSGTTQVGALTMVGADHVRLESGRCIAFHAVDAWSC